MASDIIKRATDYWSAKRQGSRMPSRPTIDPVDLADVLSNLVVVESIDNGRDYMHRIAGEQAETLLGARMHGAKLSGIEGRRAAFASWRNALNLARTFRAPHFATFETDDGKGQIRAVFLPLCRREGGEQADFVLSALIEAETSRRLR